MKVLLVRFSAIGDCVMAAHTATCIRRSHSDAHLVWAVEERCAAMVEEGRLVTRRAVYPRERWKKGAWSPSVWREQWQFYARLRHERFDLGIDLQGHSKTAICLRLSGARQRLAVRATDRFAQRLNPLFLDFGSARHVIDRQLAALRSIGTFAGEPGPPIMPDNFELRTGFREKFQGSPAVAIAVGAGHASKAYPTDHWREVASRLVERGCRIVFIGGPGEEAPSLPRTENCVGKFDLVRTTALIAECSLVLAGDTGAGHIAAAYGVPVVSIFGPTDPEEFRPYGPSATILRKSERTADVTPDEVVSAALDRLEPVLRRTDCVS